MNEPTPGGSQALTLEVTRMEEFSEILRSEELDYGDEELQRALYGQLSFHSPAFVCLLI